MEVAVRDIRLEYAGEAFPYDTQPWLDQREDDSGEEPLFTLVTVKAPPDRDALALDFVCACVGKVPRDTRNLLTQVDALVNSIHYIPGRPVCIVAHWSADSQIPPVHRS